MVPLLSPVMANNLKHFIKLSGLTQIQVAKQKGIQPESLSRHISGRSQFSIQDAIEYAEILGCAAEQLLFERKPLPIIGECVNGLTTTFYGRDEALKYITPRAQHAFDAALLRGIWTEYQYDTPEYHLIDAGPIAKRTVPQIAFGSPAYVKVKDGEATLNTDESERCFLAMIYPQPDHTYTCTALYGSKIVQGVKLEWACPRILTVERPALWGWEEQDAPEG